MQRLPIDARGYPVPAFVEWIDGVPDFRVMRGDFRVECVARSLCWLCGQELRGRRAFVIGPMCAVNRVSSEPPSHRDCAVFGATACPFLTLPKAQRRDANMPSGVVEPGGIMLARNPGVTLVWLTTSFETFRTDNGWLIRLGDPVECLWYAEGREATRAEILQSIDSGMPILESMAREVGRDAERELHFQYGRAMMLVPA
jgi:hypothetical protein